MCPRAICAAPCRTSLARPVDGRSARTAMTKSELEAPNRRSGAKSGAARNLRSAPLKLSNHAVEPGANWPSSNSMIRTPVHMRAAQLGSGCALPHWPNRGHPAPRVLGDDSLGVAPLLAWLAVQIVQTCGHTVQGCCAAFCCRVQAMDKIRARIRRSTSRQISASAQCGARPPRNLARMADTRNCYSSGS
jgi:hypothetical protein